MGLFPKTAASTGDLILKLHAVMVMLAVMGMVVDVLMCVVVVVVMTVKMHLVITLH